MMHDKHMILPRYKYDTYLIRQHNHTLEHGSTSSSELNSINGGWSVFDPLQDPKVSIFHSTEGSPSSHNCSQLCIGWWIAPCEGIHTSMKGKTSVFVLLSSKSMRTEKEMIVVLGSVIRNHEGNGFSFQKLVFPSHTTGFVHNETQQRAILNSTQSSLMVVLVRWNCHYSRDRGCVEKQNGRQGQDECLVIGIGIIHCHHCCKSFLRLLLC
mmetsp:Transcript_14934/g.36342  ORF Transcript_14934/g.36342 Transcript_14934/m.36342 type:complete len:211 (-) Transcript_14934:303-935(-)